MTFDEAKTILGILREKYQGNAAQLDIAMKTMEVVAPQFKWVSTDDCAAIVKSLDEEDRFKIDSPKMKRDEEGDK